MYTLAITDIFFQSHEVEETLKRIQTHPGVVGTIVVNNEGITRKDNNTIRIIFISWHA